LVFGSDKLNLRRFLYLMVFLGLFFTGCAGRVDEIITCDPPQADIYWGHTPSDLAKTGYKTPHSRSISDSSLKDRCYQVKKEGYHDSDVECREEEKYRYLEFRLDPIKTTITSEPPGAIIHWGPSRDQLTGTEHRTPRTVYKVKNGANWKDWYFQVRKEGYIDPEIVFLPQQSGDRRVHFELKPRAKEEKVGSKKSVVEPGRQERARETPLFKGKAAGKESVRKEKPKTQTVKRETVRKATAAGQASEKTKVGKATAAEQASEKTKVEKASSQDNVVSGTKATLTWDDQSSNESGFEIERKTGTKGVYRQIAIVGPNVTSYTDTGLHPGMTYFYRVRAYNEKGHSAYSGEIRVNVMAK
jgi:hypothetical protein